jgi:N-methylhydantoinase B
MNKEVRRPSAQGAADLITREVIRNRLNAIVAQQSLVLKNVSGSPLVAEANDCNTGLYLPDGQIVGMGPHNIFFSGAMEEVVKSIINDFGEAGIQDGDVFITNDPYRGAMHLPDVTMLMPVFCDGRHIAWVGSCCHVLDVGGMTPSSFCPAATQIYQEGLRLPPVKLIDGGSMRDDVWKLILVASRLPANAGLDLKAMIAANTHARKGLLRLVDRYGAEDVVSTMRAMLDWSELRLAERLSELPDGSWRARTYFDHDGRAPNLVRVAVTATKRGDRLLFDYSESSEQTASIYNCTLSGLRGGVLAALLPVLAHDVPWNSGLLRRVVVRCPIGKVVNAAEPAACGASTIGAAQLVQSTAKTVLSLMVSAHPRLRAEAMAGTTGAIPAFHMGGINQYGHHFGGAFTDILAGGGGATERHAGIDVAGPHEMLAYRFNNVEGDESHFPILWLRRAIGRDTGGAGRHAGGAGLSSAVTVHDAPFLHGVLMGHSIAMPSTPGIHGGMPGATVGLRIGRGTNVSAALAEGRGVTGVDQLAGAIERFIGVPGEMMLGPGDVLDWTFHGGGGWGDPLEADADSVASDVTEGRITAPVAAKIYGVIINERGVDAKLTEKHRASVRAQRRAWPRELISADLSEISPTGKPLQISDHLVLLSGSEGRRFFGCDCGHVLSPSEKNWKRYACHASLRPEDLGPRVHLHEDLVAEAYACPGCGALISIEVRWKADRPLHDIELAQASKGSV